jgi:glycogen debranching enzyme
MNVVNENEDPQNNEFYIAPNPTFTDNRTRVLNCGDTFAIFNFLGDIPEAINQVQGIYHQGTRFISQFDMEVNSKKMILLGSSVKEDNQILSVDLTNPKLSFNEQTVPEEVIHFGRLKWLENEVYNEEIKIYNYGNEPFKLELTFNIHSDFKDLFEVRGIKRKAHGKIKKTKIIEDNQIRLSYLGLDSVERVTELKFSPKPSSIEERKLTYVFLLQPHEEFKINIIGEFKIYESSENSEYEKRLQANLASGNGRSLQIAKIYTSNEQFNHWINRSHYDLLSLTSDTIYGKYPYAGVPWYNTPFGRDGIITAFETLMVAPKIAKGVLTFLAANQSVVNDTFQDAEPGKILHEARIGEMVELKEVPFKLYYGSIDATPLFVSLAYAYFERTGDLELLQTLWPNIEAALFWIDNYGDLDGDGFVEYIHKSANGLTNQGWKDSYDSISYSNGDLAEAPIALAEVQGYCYAAKIAASKAALVLGNKELANKLTLEAVSLKLKFNETFWDEEKGFYALALDKSKKKCLVNASNQGHCLFSGIVDPEKAHRVIANLLSPEMFSGWGIRTLGQNEKRYNPMSYHNGSIWPHDNALIASGMSDYGFTQETAKILQCIFDATLFIDLQRLPELYCGFERKKGIGPTGYPVACSPQAWAVGAVYSLVQSCLRIKVLANEKLVQFTKPHLPDFLDFLHISNLPIDGETCDIYIWRKDDKLDIKMINNHEEWRLQVF